MWWRAVNHRRTREIEVERSEVERSEVRQDPGGSFVCTCIRLKVKSREQLGATGILLLLVVGVRILTLCLIVMMNTLCLIVMVGIPVCFDTNVLVLSMTMKQDITQGRGRCRGQDQKGGHKPF